MLRVAICDDLPKEIKKITNLLVEYKKERPGVEIFTHVFTSGDDLLSALDNGSVFDLFLLDIIMPGQNGIELSQNIRLRYPDTPLVFLTVSEDFALDAFSVSAVQYILKPVCRDTLFRVIDKTMSAIRRAYEQLFVISTPDRTVILPFASIVCVELYRRSLRVYHENGQILNSKRIRVNFNETVAPLLADSRFLNTHKSYVFNMAWVRELTSTAFILKHDVHIPIPRYKYTEAKTKYFAWLSHQSSGATEGMNG